MGNNSCKSIANDKKVVPLRGIVTFILNSMKTFWKILAGSFCGSLLALLILFFIIAGAIGAMFSPKEGPKKLQGETILKLDFGSTVAEQANEEFSLDLTGSFSMSGSTPLLDILTAIDHAADDPAVKFILLTNGSPALTMTQAEEIRAALAAFREKSGKAVISWTSSFTDLGYYICSVSDRIIFHSYGTPALSGMSMNTLFFKDLIDRLGVEIQLIRHGKYKAAGEQFTKNGMTPENYEQNKALLDALWQGFTKEICDSRGIPVESYNGWIDNLELAEPDDLLRRGLVDELMYQDQMEEYLCELFEVDDVEKLKSTDINAYVSATKKANVRAKSSIAVVYATGEIMTEGSDKMLTSRKMVGLLSDLRRDSTIKAVVFRVNSPGGDAIAAEMIRREVELLGAAKPVVASYGDCAASGGYWISAGCERIFTDKSTITGSIGVFAMIPSVGKAMKNKLGITPAAVNTNKHSDMLSFMRPLDYAEVDYMERTIEKVYTDFTSRVADGRKMEESRVDELGQGRIWAGSDAVTYSLADEIGGLVDAIAYAESAAGLEKGSYRIEEYPAVKNFSDLLFESLYKSGVKIAVKDGIPFQAEALSKWSEIYTSSLSSGRSLILARLPYQYIIY